MLTKVEENCNVVKFIELLKTLNNYYFVYEYCNGGTLDKFMHEMKIVPEKKALSFFN